MTHPPTTDSHEDDHHHDHDHEHGHDHARAHEDWRLLAGLTLLCGTAGLAGWLVERFSPGSVILARVLYGVAVAAGAWDALVDSWENLRERKIDIHFLMIAVAAGAIAIGSWGEAVLLLFLFSGAGAMEGYASDRTQREVGALLKSAPKQACVLDDKGGEQQVPAESLIVGQRVRVRPGDVFAADGWVTAGASAADESNLTGEATPVNKQPGDRVFSGTINLWGSVDFEVQKLPSESTLQKIIRLIESAQKLRAPSQRFTDKFGTGYTYAVIGGSAAMFLVWWLGFHLPPFANTAETRSAFYRAMTLMVVASPCALVISIPSAILAAIAWGARRGVLFRGGAAIEGLAEVSVVALDKTGTLTTGEMEVATYESFPAGQEHKVMAFAYALESSSEHPIARAIVRDARTKGAPLAKVRGFRNIAGQGVQARVDEIPVTLGRRELVAKEASAAAMAALPPPSDEHSEVWVASADLVGRVLLRDRVRSESRKVLAELKAMGLRTIMLTGDRREAADRVAQDLGLSEVRSQLTPEQKVEVVQELRKSAPGVRVAMVGDGVNDAPSLAAADVSVAMGARGSDAALEQAQVILMEDRIGNFLAAVRLSRRAKAIIRQNLTISLGVVGVMIIATAAGVVPLTLGVAAHEGSTLLVCANSLRLLFGRND